MREAKREKDKSERRANNIEKERDRTREICWRRVEKFLGSRKRQRGECFIKKTNFSNKTLDRRKYFNIKEKNLRMFHHKPCSSLLIPQPGRGSIGGARFTPHDIAEIKTWQYEGGSFTFKIFLGNIFFHLCLFL